MTIVLPKDLTQSQIYLIGQEI